MKGGRNLRRAAWRLIVIVGLGAGLVSLSLGIFSTGSAAPRVQGFQTPTPGPDGKIVYIVKAGDDLWTIAALSGKTVEEIMALNGIQPGDFITPGMQLLLGLAGPVVPTAAPESRPTVTIRPPTPTPIFGAGAICVLLFLDVNGNASVDEGEIPLEGGQISLAEPSGIIVGEQTTTADPEGYCFEDVLNGDYNVSAAAPQDYNPTTAMNTPIRLAPGEVKYIEFGAQASAAITGGGGGGASRSSVLGVLGLGLLVAAGALGFFAYRYGRRTPMSLR
jgi:hypothetical protein